MESSIMRQPPYVREIWDYLLMNANHKDGKFNGLIIERGQMLRSYKQIIEDLHWYVGWRKMTYQENHMKKAMKYLRGAFMITTRKIPMGVIITVCNYDAYQSPENYERTNEEPIERTRTEPELNQSSEGKNKNSKNSKNSKNEKKKILCSSGNELELEVQEPKEEFYPTKKGRKLKGQRLIDFLDFWKAFDYKRGKPNAADSWLDIQGYNEPIFLKIMSRAHKECKSRKALLSAGRTPKMAQGWISDRRWEDEDDDNAGGLNTITDNNEVSKHGL